MSILMLSPNSAGDTTAIASQYPNSDYHWDKVDEASPDDTTTYVFTDDELESYELDLYAVPDHTSETGTISSVTIYWRCYGDGGGNNSGKGAIKTGGTVYYGTAYYENNAWVTRSKAWTTNPQAGGAWTWAQIDALQIGVALASLSTGYIRCTQVYVEVDYTSIVTVTASATGQSVGVGSATGLVIITASAIGQSVAVGSATGSAETTVIIALATGQSVAVGSATGSAETTVVIALATGQSVAVGSASAFISLRIASATCQSVGIGNAISSILLSHFTPYHSHKTYTVRILSHHSAFVGLAELDDFRSLEFTRRWQKANGLTVNVSQYSPNIAYLTDGNYVEVRKNNAPLVRMLIAEEGINLTEDGKLSELWEILGVDVITRRICLIPIIPNSDGREHMAGSGETILRLLVERNVIAPTDANRIIPDIALEPDLMRGTVLDDVAVRYEVLVDKLEEVCRSSTIGWELIPVAGGLDFHVIAGIDRSISQVIYPPVVFSPDRGNIRILSYRFSKVGRANLAYAGGGPNQGAAREIEIVYLEPLEPTGADRCETFLNASDTTGVLSVTQRAEAELDAQAPLERLEAEVLLPDGLGDARRSVIVTEDTAAEFATGTLVRTFAEAAGDLALHPKSLWDMFHAKSLWGVMEAP